MANSIFAFWNFWNFFPNIFDLQLVESADAEFVDMEGQHYACDYLTFSFLSAEYNIYGAVHLL